MLLIGQGQFSFNYRGNWDATVSYDSNDAIRGSDGKLYVATEDNVPVNTDPVSANRYWAEATSSAIPVGQTGMTGRDGNTIEVVFYDLNRRPSPSGALYDGMTFTPPSGSLPSIPASPSQIIWAQFYKLRNDTSPPSLDDLGLIQLTGLPGRDGATGQRGATGVGVPGQDGDDGQDGADGTDGNNGQSSQIIYRKTLEVELLDADAPTVTYDGTSLDLPDTDNDAWDEQPYHSKVAGSFNLHADQVNPVDVDVDEVEQIVYVLDNGRAEIPGPPVVPEVPGRVYRYNMNGTYIDRWLLAANNNNAIGLDVTGSLVRVLDSEDHGTNPNQYNQVYAYSKTDGGRQSGVEFRVPRNGNPVVRNIAVHGNSIYIVTQTSIRRFSLANRTELMTGNLSSLRSSPEDLQNDNINPQGADANAYYFMTMDPTQRKVYVRDIDTLALRHQYREFPLGAANGSPSGIAITERQVLIIDATDSSIYRYYNPDNILWGSTLTIQENAPYSVSSTAPYDMTGQRGEQDIVIQGTGTGTDGDDGEDGSSVDIVFRAVSDGSGAPDTPSGGTFTNGELVTAPNNWHLKVVDALQGFTNDDDVYASIVRRNGVNGTITYDQPTRFNGDRGQQGIQGIPGSAAAAGNSVEFIYQTASTPPSVPSGGTFIAATRNFTPPSGWTVNAPSSIPDGENLYLVESVLPGEGTDGGGTIMYRTPIRLPEGAQGERGLPSTVPGPEGVGFRIIFREDTTMPALPTGGTWDGSTFRAPSNWLENAPHRTPNDPEDLYATGVELPSGGGTPHYTGVFQMNGTAGRDGDSTRTIYTKSATEPTRPTDGTGTWNGTDYDPPPGWHEDIPVGDDTTYASMVSLSGSDKTNTGITYSAVTQFSAKDGRDGVPGVETNVEMVSFIPVADSSVTSRDYTSTKTAGQNDWSEQNSEELRAFTGSGDNAISLINSSGPNNTQGIVIQDTGVYSIVTELAVFIISTDEGEFHTDMVHTDSSGTILDHYPSQDFFIEDPFSSGNEFGLTLKTNIVVPPRNFNQGDILYIRYSWRGFTPPGNRRTNTSSAISFRNIVTTNGIANERIEIRKYLASGGGTTSGTDGNSIDIIYRRSATELTIPPSGGAARDGRLTSAPTGWSLSPPGGTDPIYTSFAHISGSTDNPRYDEPIRWTGPDGQTGGVGPASTVPGPRGIQGVRGYSTGIAYLISPNTPTDPSGGTAVDGQLTVAPGPGSWQLDMPPVGNVTWIAFAQIDGNTIRSWSDAQRLTGRDGPAGQAPFSWQWFFQRTATDTRPDAPTNLSYNSGQFGNLGSWVPAGANTGTGRYLWALRVRYIINRDGNLAVAQPFQFGGFDGARGLTGISEVSVWARATTPPGVPSALTFNQDRTLRSSVAEGLTWHRSARAAILATSTGVLYRATGDIDVNPPNPTVTWLGSPIRDGTDGIPGAVGYGYRDYYHANSANSVSNPLVTYNGTDFTAQSGWDITVPTAADTGVNAGDYVFVARVRYREGTAGATVEGTAIFGRVPGTVAPPAGTMSYSAGVEYGNAVGNTPTTKQGDVNTFALAIGDSHTTENVDMTTTDTNTNYYIRLASGLRLTGARESVDGDEFTAWNRIGNTQVYIYQIGFRSSNTFNFTVRRDS